MPWQEDAARPELSAGCSHCVFEKSRFPSLLLSGRQATRFAAFLPPPGPCLQLSPPGTCPSLRFPWRESEPSAPVCGVLCMYPRFMCMCWLSGERERQQAVRPLSVSALLGTDSVHAMFTSFQREACTKKLASADWLSSLLARGLGMAQMTSSRSCPPSLVSGQVSLVTCLRGKAWGWAGVQE